jgi:hypothetical protein
MRMGVSMILFFYLFYRFTIGILPWHLLDVAAVGLGGQDDVMRRDVACGRSNQFAPCASIPYALVLQVVYFSWQNMLHAI